MIIKLAQIILKADEICWPHKGSIRRVPFKNLLGIKVKSNKIKLFYVKSSGRLLKRKKLVILLQSSPIIKHSNSLKINEISINNTEPTTRYILHKFDQEESLSSSSSSLSSLSLSENQDQDKKREQQQQQLQDVKEKEIIESENILDIDKFKRQLNKIIILQRQHRPQKLLVFVNPFGGKGKALSLYKTIVKPLFELAKVDVKLIVTKYANHARDTIEDPGFNIHSYDGIVCVGGDGMFSELMNGLLFRTNKHLYSSSSSLEVSQEEGSQTTSTTTSASSRPSSQASFLCSAQWPNGSRICSPTIPIGVIGAGSTDANSFGLIGTNDVITATLNIILGNQIKVDVCSLHSIENDKLVRFVSTFVGYGYFGDVIRESERLRWLGPTRYDIIGFNNLLKNRSYKGHLRILVSEKDGSPMNNERCHRNCKLCLSKSDNSRSQSEEDNSFDKDSNISNNNNNNDYKDDVQDDVRSNKPLKSISEENSGDLKLIEIHGSFVGVNAAVTACRCPQTRKGFAPSNHLANGCADLIIVRACSRIQYFRYLIRTAWTKKSPFDLKYVDTFRCREFEFIADYDNHSSSENSCSSSNSCNSTSTSTSSWNADGEVLNEYSIRVKVNNQLLRVFGTGEPEI